MRQENQTGNRTENFDLEAGADLEKGGAVIVKWWPNGKRLCVGLI